MKYVLDENGNIKIGSKGHPVVIGDDDKEYEIDAIGAQTTITALHKESASNRAKATEHKKRLDAFGDMDPVAAKEAITTVAGLTTDHKIKVDTLKKEMNDAWQVKFDEEVSKGKTLSDDLFNAKVTAKFATSEIVKKTVLTPDIAAKFFGGNFNVDGTAKDVAGNIIYSKEKPGEPANFDEALSAIIDNYPNKNAILKGSGTGGSGSHGAGSGGSGSEVANFFIKGHKQYSLTEQAKIAKSNPEQYKQLKAQSLK
jgi:hypothetical protein